LNCKDVIREVSDYLDGNLGPGVKSELEVHLVKCKDCKLIIDTTSKTIDIYCNSEPVALPVDVKMRLHEALAKKLARRPS
jgi:hypothetical protein